MFHYVSKNAHIVRYDTEVESAVVFQKSDPPCIFSPAKPERGNVLSDHLQTLRLPHDNLEANGDCGYKARTIEELLEQGEARGEARGRIDAIQNMIDLGLTKEQILKKYSPEEYEKALNSMPVKA